MEPPSEAVPADRHSSPFSVEDVQAILERRGWFAGTAGLDPSTVAARQEWLAQAAQLLGAQAATLAELERLLEEVFEYDARASLARVENQAVMAREAARLVLRELANLVLDSTEVNSDRFKEIITTLKERTGRRGQQLFHPVRLALAGRAGEGEHDRVILLLDSAARFAWAAPVKNCRQRILEFCGVFD